MLEKHFDFATEETKIYSAQEEAGLFRAGAGSCSREGENFSIMIPPPNVTGSLHMGHALNNTLQDMLVRRKRMQGYNVLWQVGCDHAGIATQSVVERQLEADGKKRDQMSRGEFIDHVWAWKEKSGGTIMQQLRRLGASCDFSRERFTMDEGLSGAVLKVFVSLYKEGLIYRDKRLVNWDCGLQTAISDLEVIPTETKGHLWHFRYDLQDKQSEDDYIIIATTRPETMFGDMAVAVNPTDGRYEHLIGKHVVLPISGRLIPIIADEYADPELGTGAVKITPAHDFNDFEVGKRHHLEMLNILHPDGTLNDTVPEAYRGLDRFVARKKLVAELEASRVLTEIKPHLNKIPVGDRSGTIIEPYLTDQWYVDAYTLAQPALNAVREGDTRFIPANWDKTYYAWLDNIQPWCISRQLWWGHQIPAWYGHDGYIFVAESEEQALLEAEEHYGKKTPLTRDSDVLDTWFSSALWPFSTLGWPEKTTDLETYYPTSVLITGFDIIFFWVARMLMLGLHFTKQVPFKDIYIHALVRDEKGQKMSKSKGNVIDPIDLIDTYGADALRFTLCAMAAQGRDIKLATSRIEGYRNFGTKLWNAARFAQMNECVYDASFKAEDAVLPLSHWILSRLKKASMDVDMAYEAYRFNDIAGHLYHFVWNDFCDRFVEMSKPLLQNGTPEQQQEMRLLTAYILRHIYILLHPIMPFITENLASETGCVTDTPLVHTAWSDFSFLSLDGTKIKNIDLIVSLIDVMRSLRSAVNVPASAKISLIITEANAQDTVSIRENKDILKQMARLSEIIFADATYHLPSGTIGVSSGSVVALFPLADVIDIGGERSRLEKDVIKMDKDIQSTLARLGNEKFLEKADPDVVFEMRERLNEQTQTKDKTMRILQSLG